MSTVVVTWMNGEQESYHQVTEWRVDDGLLWLIPRREIPQKPGRCIPLCNVRIWTVRE